MHKNKGGAFMKESTKKMLLAWAFLTSVPFLCACAKTPKSVEPTQLDAPQNVSIEQNVVSWKQVENAEFYDVNINGNEYRVFDTTFDAGQLFDSKDMYQVTIVAGTSQKNFVESSPSQTAIVDNREKLETPQNFALDAENEQLSWALDGSVQSYVLKVNGASVVLEQDWLTIENGTVLFDIKNVENYLGMGANNTFSLYGAETSKNKASDETQSLSFLKQGTQDAVTNVAVQKSGTQIALTFDKVATAKNGYTYFVDGEETGTITLSNFVDISAKISGFGKHAIAVKTNAVQNDAGQTLFVESALSKTEFENIPTFVDGTVQNLQVDSGSLTFDLSEGATLYGIIIKKTVYGRTTKVFQQQYTLEELEQNQNKVDISSLTENGIYDVSVTAMAYGSNNEQYASKAGTFQFAISQKLATPTVTVDEFDDSVLVNVSGVENAKRVSVFVNADEPTYYISNNEQKKSVILSIDKSTLLFGNNNIYCQAMGDNQVYFDSNTSLICAFKIAKIVSPENLKIANDVLSFTYAGDFDSFVIYCNNERLGTTDTTRFDIKIDKVGRYALCVSAKYGEREGEKSAPITYKVTEKLSAPTNLDVQGNVLTFDEVANASGYTVFLNNASNTNVAIVKNATSNQITLPNDSLLAGQNTICVVACGDNDIYFDSAKSAPFTFEKVGTLDEAKNINVSVSNETYYLSFDAVAKSGSYQIKITDPLGTESELTSDTNSQIDVTTCITIPGEYQIEVTAISASKAYVDSVATQSQIFDVLFTKTYYQNNSYFYDGKTFTYVVSATDADKLKLQLYDLVFYSVMYGKDDVQVYITPASQNALNLANVSLKSLLPCVSNYGVSFSGNDFSKVLLSLVFKGYDSLKPLLELVEMAHDQIYLYFDIDNAQTKLIDSAKSTNVYNIKFTYESGFTTEAKNRVEDGEQMVDMYNVTERTDFAIDNLTQTAPVETVAQLLMVVQNDRKPEFTTPNTIAEKTYNYAKNVLSKICTNSMTDVQKAVAIYDWIMIQNTYSSATFSAASGAPFSIDNLNNMDFYASGMILYHKSVCKGYAQAFALMCNIEGIKVVETFGLCGGNIDYSQFNYANSSQFGKTISYFVQNMSAVSSISGHSWNRIYIDLGKGAGKQWYIADPTWDDPDNSSMPNVVRHEYLFANDADIAKNRKEFYPNGSIYHRTDSNGNVIDYSATDTTDYFVCFDAVATSSTDIDNIVLAKLSTQETLDLQYDGITNAVVESAITKAKLNASDYTIYVYGGKYAYICKK